MGRVRMESEKKKGERRMKGEDGAKRERQIIFLINESELLLHLMLTVFKNANVSSAMNKKAFPLRYIHYTDESNPMKHCIMKYLME